MKDIAQIENLNITTLKEQLENNGVDIFKWGKGDAKTVEHLQKEIENEESFLGIEDSGELIRRVMMIGADVYYTSQDGKRYRLKEDKQIFNDGRERRRDYGHAVSEKMRKDEEPEIAMIRGIREELGIEGDIEFTKTAADERVLYSPSYPGLKSHYTRYGFEVLLNEEQFVMEGYVEKDWDKKTYFVWEEMDEKV